MKYVYQLFLYGQRNLHVGLSCRAIQRVQHKHVKAGGYRLPFQHICHGCLPAMRMVRKSLATIIMMNKLRQKEQNNLTYCTLFYMEMV